MKNLKLRKVNVSDKRLIYKWFNGAESINYKIKTEKNKLKGT